MTFFPSLSTPVKRPVDTIYIDGNGPATKNTITYHPAYIQENQTATRLYFRLLGFVTHASGSSRLSIITASSLTILLSVVKVRIKCRKSSTYRKESFSGRLVQIQVLLKAFRISLVHNYLTGSYGSIYK